MRDTYSLPLRLETSSFHPSATPNVFVAMSIEFIEENLASRVIKTSFTS